MTKSIKNKPFKKSFTLHDKDNNKFEINCEIKFPHITQGMTGKKIPNSKLMLEFTASGKGAGSCGQCLDKIKPANASQAEFIKYWDYYHLKTVPEGFISSLKATIKKIEALEVERSEEIIYSTDDELLKIIEEKTDFTGRDAELCAAFVKMFNLKLDDLASIGIGNDIASVQGTDYIAGNDNEMDEAWEQYLRDSIDDCMEIPDHIRPYFDEERWINDAKIDGRGHCLNHYDGGEESAIINGTWYYAYQQ